MAILHFSSMKSTKAKNICRGLPRCARPSLLSRQHAICQQRARCQGSSPQISLHLPSYTYGRFFATMCEQCKGPSGGTRLNFPPTGGPGVQSPVSGSTMLGSMLKSLYTVKRCLSCLSTPGLSTHMAVKLVFSSLCARWTAAHTLRQGPVCMGAGTGSACSDPRCVCSTRHGGRCGYEHGRGG